MKQFIPIIALFLILTSTACTPIDFVEGSDLIRTESRLIHTRFNHISLASTIDATLIQGDSFSIVVKGNDNILPLLETYLTHEDVLMIHFRNNTSLRNVKTEVIITAPQLKGIQIGGTGNLIIPKPFHFNDLHLNMAGTGDATLNGSAKNMIVKQSSTGTIKAFNCPTDNLEIDHFGTSDAEVTVLKEMQIILGGTGDIIFKGNPLLKSSQISGTGKLKKG